MNPLEKRMVLEAMERFGGSFVRALAEAWRKADADNSARLEQAFPEYAREYLDLAKGFKETKRREEK